MASSKQYADKDDAVTLTCSFTDPASITATVTWYMDDNTIAAGITQPSDGKSILTLASAALTDNGEYKCDVDYGVAYGGSKTVDNLKQYVRGIDTGLTGPQYALIGTAVTHTCTVYGDELTGGVVWTNTDGSLTADRTYTQATQAYSASAYTTTSTLVISATHNEDETSFICTVTYTQGAAAGSATIIQEILCKYCNGKSVCVMRIYSLPINYFKLYLQI